jgi:transposase-like protein
MSDIKCKYCKSELVRKYGLVNDKQRYYCNNCKHKFVDTNTIPKMKTPTKCISGVLSMYYEGMSENEIRRNLIQQDSNYISNGTVYNWVRRFTDLAIEQTKNYKPKVGGVWIADETVIEIDGKNVWFWDIIDAKTRYLIASHMSFTRTSKDAEELMKQAYNKTGRVPRIIYTDKLRAYLEGIESVFGGDTEHRQGSPFDVEDNTNFIERFHSTLKERTKVLRGLKSIATARKFLDGWLVHYNYFRPHMSLNDRTPAEVAGIKTSLHNWKDVCEQPYHITANIKIIPFVPQEPKYQTTRKPLRKKKVAKRRVIKQRSRLDNMCEASTIRLK